MKRLRDVVTKSIIVCYKEDVVDLHRHLSASGLAPMTLRGTYSEQELKLPATTRTFMNHRDAWRIAAETPGYTVICEADFVPCRDLATLPVFWPLDNPLAWGYLYQGSPRLLAIVEPGAHLRGHCAPLVGYIINQTIAGILLQFYEYERAKHGLDSYSMFDAHLQWWAMGLGAEAYIPPRHYGEHGGLPNPEHAKHALLSRAGRHRADNLAGPLAFLPQYAKGSRVRYMRERIKYRSMGWGRLLTGRWIVDTNVYSRDRTKTIRMLNVGFKRLLPRGLTSSRVPFDRALR